MTKKEIKLISGGRISKKQINFSKQYYRADGSKIDWDTDISTHKDEYRKVLGMGRSESIFYIPMKTCFKLNGTIKGRRKNRDYELTQTLYLYSDIEDEDEAEKLLEKVWSKKTNFDSKYTFSREEDVPAGDIGEDQFRIKAKYVEGAKREYEDQYATEVTNTRINLKQVKKEFEESFQTDNSGVKKIGGKKYGWFKIEK